MYIILDGTVEVIKRLILAGMDDDDSAEKSKVFTKIHAAGRHPVFGEIALLQESKRTATVRAHNRLHPVRNQEGRLFRPGGI